MNILITGVAGFIGFNSAISLLKNKNNVFGIDNIDKYYSSKLKFKRLKKLKLNKKFRFQKIDLKNKKKLFNFLKNKKIDVILHFAAQPGVRYSFINPSKYIGIEGISLVTSLRTLKYHYIIILHCYNTTVL